MPPIKPLGVLIEDITTFDKYIDRMADVEVVLSTENRFPTYPFWLKYRSGNYFAFNMGKIPEMVEMLDRTEAIFRSVVPMQYPISRKRIRLIKNSNLIKSHIDRERHTGINVGLRNSSSATTFICTNDNNDEESFLKNQMSFVTMEGCGYLFNAMQRHSVVGTDVHRYILSYSMNIPYSDLFEQIDR